MRGVFWTGLAIAAALVLASSVSRAFPEAARVLDPFLLVVVYCGLCRGEVQGMLAGLAAGWVQDVHFGGTVLGIAPLSKLAVGYAVGLAASRFLLTGPGPRTLTLLLAATADALLFSWVASVFDVRTAALTPLAVASRATVNAAVGVALFELIDRRVRREAAL
jgi:rod shape-determining protein MreD